MRKRKTKHRYNTYALIAMLIIIAGAAITAFEPTDLDTVCGDNDSILYKYPLTSWACRNLTTAIEYHNYTHLNTINITALGDANITGNVTISDYLFLTDGTSDNYIYWRIFDTAGGIGEMVATDELRFKVEDDTNDYIEFGIVANNPRIRSRHGTGNRLLITDDTGLIEIDRSNLTFDNNFNMTWNGTCMMFYSGGNLTQYLCGDESWCIGNC